MGMLDTLRAANESIGSLLKKSFPFYVTRGITTRAIVRASFGSILAFSFERS